MTTTIRITGLLIAVAATALTGCRKMTIDSEQWRQILQENYLVDTVDRGHTWDLLRQHSLTVHADLPDDNIERVQILSGDPYAQEDVEILVERRVVQGETVKPRFYAAATQTEFWAAAVTAQGGYYVVPFGSAEAASFLSDDVKSTGTLHTPRYQTLTYLFDDDYPLPGDFDYNDVVLRISQSSPAPNLLKLTVTLAAVGTTKQVAAAICLPNIVFSKVERVEIEEGTRFDENYPIDRYMIDNDAIAVESRNGSTVINLFDDAHWSLRPLEENGQLVRMFYNTCKDDVKGESGTVSAVTRSYLIYLDESIDDTYQQLGNIDPFVITTSNGLNVEIHTYQYKYTEAIWHYTNGSGGSDDHVPWALMVPDGAFHYPVEGMAIGGWRNGEATGAYNCRGHSFGEWGRDRNASTDWWLYDNADKENVY